MSQQELDMLGLTAVAVILEALALWVGPSLVGNLLAWAGVGVGTTVAVEVFSRRLSGANAEEKEQHHVDERCPGGKPS